MSKSEAQTAIEKEIAVLLPKVLKGTMDMFEAKKTLDETARRVLGTATAHEVGDILAIAKRAANIADGFHAQLQESIVSAAQEAKKK